MAEIKTQKDFLKWINPPSESLSKDYYFKTNYSVGQDMLYLRDLTLNSLDLKDRHFESTEFLDCIFENCEFTHSFIVSCTLKNCTFKNCTFTWSKFLESDLINTTFNNCVIAELELCDIVIEDSSFINCREIFDLTIRGNWKRSLSFQNCYVAYLDIEPIKNEHSERFEFIDCIINYSSFDRIDFTKSKFINCSLSVNQFSSCLLSGSTLVENNNTPGSEYNLIDFRTILNSENQSEVVLEKIFGIHNSDIKEYVYGLTSKIEFQSIFISYSFKDKVFAKRINEELIRKGIMTFLWEKDSPGGKTLKDIMSSNINAKDRILFIASKDSLKSTACQFELSEGRKKQNVTWENVLFPIHIDNYLFDLKKEQIRPVKVQDEYWENICELRNLNSLDFSGFNKVGFSNIRDYENLIYRLIKGLRKGK